MTHHAAITFLRLMVSVEALAFLTLYLVTCELLASRAREFVFSLALECYWAVCFSYLLCRVFLVGTRLSESLLSAWPWVFGALLLVSALPAGAVRALTQRPIFPPLLGILHTTWLVCIASAVLWFRGLLLIPSLDTLALVTILAIVFTTVVGLVMVALAAASARAGNPRAQNMFDRAAGWFTSYIPICLYGASLRSA